MANAGKVLAFIGAILTILGTYFFTLSEGIFPGLYVYGAGGMFNIDELFVEAVSGDPNAWQYWIIAPVTIIYLISGLIQLLGIKSRVAAFLGCLIPLTVVVFVILAFAGVSSLAFYILVLSAAPLVPNIIPVTFEYSFMNIGLGAFIIGFGSILTLISVFMSRED